MLGGDTSRPSGRPHRRYLTSPDEGAASLDGTLEVFAHPLLVLLDLLLVWAVLFHSFNGIRVVMMDLGMGIRRHTAVFLTLMLLAIVSLSLFALKAFQVIGRG